MSDIPTNLIVADIGNSFLKVGRFQSLDAEAVPEPDDVLDCAKEAIPTSLRDWLPSENCDWLVSSVNREMESCLSQWIANERNDRYALLTSHDVDMPIQVEFPDRVGMDRLAAAVVANSLRRSDQAAIVIDAGSAITVDVVSSQGEFLGGAILPGLMMSAAVLASKTDLLPLVPASYRDDPPDVLGRSTEAAMRSGLYWGIVGAVKELVQKLADQLVGDTKVVISGGTAEILKDRLSFEVCHVPQLVLSGIALIAHSKSRQGDESES